MGRFLQYAVMLLLICHSSNLVNFRAWLHLGDSKSTQHSAGSDLAT
jgi:hypothetical protein